MTNTVHVIGAAAGIAANISGCSFAPIFLQNSPFLQYPDIELDWEEILYIARSERGLAATDAVAALCQQLAEYTYRFTQEKQHFLTIGGDHSCAIGTWSGAAAALRRQGPLGLLWIDAHMDSHTPATTLTGNIHGMPMACLLGEGPKQLTTILDAQPKLLPEHVCLVGIRSFEPAEAELLKRLNVRCFLMPEIKERGLTTVLTEALQIVTQGTVGYGVSIDIDAFDPHEAPAVGVPEPDGLNAAEVCAFLTRVQPDPRFVGAEITEFNPNLDDNHRTEKLVGELIKALFSRGQANE